jgi:hypothetical protein
MSDQTDVQDVQQEGDLWATPAKTVKAQPSLVEKLMESDLLPMPIWVSRAIARVRTWGKETPEGYSTGFASLDRYFRFCPEEVYLIAARPSQGGRGQRGRHPLCPQRFGRQGLAEAE